jgi:signal transduction histidine kinase
MVLRNIENRAKQIGGKIKIKTAPNTGTTIRYIGKAGNIGKLKFLFNQ